MNYHFDAQTGSQLIHLVGGQHLDLENISFDEKKKELVLPVKRDAEPNADSYRVHFYHVLDWRLESSKGLKETAIEAVDVTSSLITVFCCEASIKLKVNSVAVSAMGSRAKRT